MAAAFTFERVSVEASAGTVLADVTCSIPAAGISVLVGPSGSGKSTMLRLCNRLEVPTSGVVRFHGVDVAAIDPLQLRRRVGMVFPKPVLLGGTVRDNLLLARAGAGDAELEAVLDRVELPRRFLDRAADSLSTGEAQRACLARTLLTEPEVLLADEATAALDVDRRHGLEALARRLAGQGMVILWVTHDLAQARRLADYLVAVFGGRIAAAGSPGEVAADPAVAGFLTRDADAG